MGIMLSCSALETCEVAVFGFSPDMFGTGIAFFGGAGHDHNAVDDVYSTMGGRAWQRPLQQPAPDAATIRLSRL